eukprot:859848-Ditylum_brightwellii.AAC.1
MDDYKINEDRHNIHPFLSTWDDIYSTKKQATAPMHTMGPGIAKDTVTMALEFAALQNKKSPFMKESGQLLNYIADMKSNAAEAFHNDSILKIPPEQRGGSVEQVEDVIESLASMCSHFMQELMNDHI